MIDSIKPVRVLHGHTDEASAYHVDDYPYGYSLRCQIRYWVETAAKGAAKGSQRFVSQTTNPKRGDTWNKPKASTYHHLMWLYLDESDHVQYASADIHIGPVQDARLRFLGIIDAMTDRERAVYNVLVAMAKKYAPPWEDYAKQVAELVEHTRTTGAEPEFIDGAWDMPNGRRMYIHGDYDLPVYLTEMRHQLAGAEA